MYFLNGTWNDKVKEFLEKDCIDKGYPATDANMLEALTEGDVVYEEVEGSHRWWDDVFKVVKIGDKFVGYTWGNVTGDTSLTDTGWEFDRSSAVFCVPKVVTKIIYVAESNG